VKTPKGSTGHEEVSVTRMATASLMRQALLKAKSYMEKKEKYANEPEKQPDFDLGMEHLCMVLRKEIP